MPYLALIDQLNSFLRQPSSILVIVGYSFNDDHLNDTILNALKANPNSMVIAMLHGTLTYKEQGSEKVIERYEKARKLALKRNNLAIWAYDEAIIGRILGKWKAQELIEEENLATCIVSDTNEENLHLLKIGDFAKLGEFLKALTGYNQTILDEE
jgi:hypothetical protein